MHSISEEGEVCVDLEHYKELSDSIRLRNKIDFLMVKHDCPKEIPHFSISILFRSGKRGTFSSPQLGS